MDPKVIIAISVVLGVIALVTLPFYLVIIPVIGILYGLWRLTELFVDMRKETKSSANMKRAGYTAGMFVGLMVLLGLLIYINPALRNRIKLHNRRTMYGNLQ